MAYDDIVSSMVLELRRGTLVMLVLSWAGAALLSLAMSGSDMLTPAATPAIVVQSATFGSMFTVLIMGVLGALSIVGEGLLQLTTVPAEL